MKKIINHKLNTSKIAIFFEGETEEIFIKYLKTQILQNRILSICKKHSFRFDGGFQKEKLKIIKGNCCELYVVIDQDDKDEQKLNEIKKIVNSNKGILIQSCPSVEIIFLSFFENLTKTK